MKLEDIRREYVGRGLSRKDLLADPIEQFTVWMQQACDAGVVDSTAMTLATVSAQGQASQRVVLLKHIDTNGFVFYTNLDSRKAQEIAGNPHVSLLFAWLTMNRQVIVQGTAERLSSVEVMKYFVTRPRDSQLAAWASHQSHPIGSRALLEQAFDNMKRKFIEGKVPLPSFWGGFRVRHKQIEFWQGRENRLHDRFQYSSDDSGQWQIVRLAP
ncbi:MAG: pyridoxamine 5'-phosphate oxidase [Gammaproteobacteria bacterium]|nr:pyridoxamine 5'-phosphate oxidase [Gammaproteobacteria bacterium]